MADPGLIELSDAEIAVLNGARRILDRLADDCRERGHLPTSHTAAGPVGGFDYGVVSTEAKAAKDAIFGTLNVARAYLYLPISDEQMYDRGQQAVAQ